MRFSSAQELLHWTRAASALWFFLDYDGTLASLSPLRDPLRPDRAAIDLLGQLSAKPDTRLAVISGRRLEDLQILLPVPGIYLAGVYGIDLLTPAKERLQRVDYTHIRPFLEAIKPQWEKLLAKQTGYVLEDKGWSLALHGSPAGTESGDRAIRSARQLAQRSLPADRFRLLQGQHYLEVAPAQAHKGKSVSFLLDHFPYSAAQLVYIGDDDKDEEAFETIHSHGGIAILVSDFAHPPVRTIADYIMASPGEVRQWLMDLCLPPKRT